MLNNVNLDVSGQIKTVLPAITTELDVLCIDVVVHRDDTAGNGVLPEIQIAHSMDGGGTLGMVVVVVKVLLVEQ
jgi:hypothetical protein